MKGKKHVSKLSDTSQSLYYVGKLFNLKKEVISGNGFLFADEGDIARGLNEKEIDLDDDEVYLVKLVPSRVFINISVDSVKVPPKTLEEEDEDREGEKVEVEIRRIRTMAKKRLEEYVKDNKLKIRGRRRKGLNSFREVVIEAVIMKHGK